MTVNPLRPRTLVSAYVDGTSVRIEPRVLASVPQFERAQQEHSDTLQVVIDGVRRSKAMELARFGAFSLLPVAASAGLGAALAAVGEPAAGLAVAGLLALSFGDAGLPALKTAFSAHHWPSQTRYEVGQGTRPTPVPKPGVERLRNLVDSDAQEFPGSRHVLYLSGHGNGREVAGMDLKDLRQGMQGVHLDATVTDACICSQLEVLSQMAPWAGLVLASSHTVPAKGFPIEKVLSQENLESGTVRQEVLAMARAAEKGARSLAVVDTQQLQQALLPALDRLGPALAAEPRSLVRHALAHSLSPGLLPSSRVDLLSFLDQLWRQPLAPVTREALEGAVKAAQATVLQQKNGHSLTFDLVKGQDCEVLPQGWRGFLQAEHFARKPLW